MCFWVWDIHIQCLNVESGIEVYNNMFFMKILEPGQKPVYSNCVSCVLQAGATQPGALSLDSQLANSSTTRVEERLCALCLHSYSQDAFPLLRNCAHLFCIYCLQTYIRIEIQEGRVNLKCPQCSESMHPNGT